MNSSRSPNISEVRHGSTFRPASARRRERLGVHPVGNSARSPGLEPGCEHSKTMMTAFIIAVRGDIADSRLPFQEWLRCVLLEQPRQPQGPGRATSDRGGGSVAALSSALQPRLQSDRRGLLQTESLAAQGRRANRRWTVEQNRRASIRLHPKPMRKLLRRLRL